MEKLNSMMRLIILCSIGLAVSLTAVAQQALSLDQAIEYALSENLGIQIARNQESIAANSTTRGNAGALPGVTAGGSYSGSLTNTKLVFAGNAQPPIEVDGAQTATVSGNLTASYNLFNGFLATNTFSKLEGQRDLAHTEALIQIETILINVINGYHMALQIQSNLKSADESASISARRYERAKLRSEFGSGTSIELLNAEVDLQNDSISVFTLKQQLENAKSNLKYLMGMTDLNDFELIEGVVLQPLEEKEKIESLANSQNLSVQQARQNQQISETDLAISKAGLYPKLSLQAAYQYSNNQSDANFVVENRSAGLNGSIGLSYNLFGGGQTRIKQQNAEVLWETAQLRQEDLSRRIETDIDNAYTNHKNNLALLSLREAALKANERNFERSEALFKNGQITGTDFREAQLNKVMASVQLDLAKIAAKLSEYELMRLTGELVNNWEG